MRIAAFGQKAGLCRKREHLNLFHNDQLYTSGDRSDRGFGRRSLCCDRSGHGRKCRWHTGDFGSDRFRKILPDGSLQSDGSRHDISVQNVGDSTWSSTSVTTTATGADGSGSTEDACIEVPSESCIVRCSMYVEPMGRNVIFYFYPGDYQSGNQTDFKAINVTETVINTWKRNIVKMQAKQTSWMKAAGKL